jgi:hypothetical protein
MTFNEILFICTVPNPFESRDMDIDDRGEEYIGWTRTSCLCRTIETTSQFKNNNNISD